MVPEIGNVVDIGLGEGVGGVGVARTKTTARLGHCGHRRVAIGGVNPLTATLIFAILQVSCFPFTTGGLMSDLPPLVQQAVARVYRDPSKAFPRNMRAPCERSVPVFLSELRAGESPEAVLFGQFRVGTSGPLAAGGLWATNQRLIFVGWVGLTFRSKAVSEFSYELFTGAEQQGLRGWHKLTLRLAGEAVEMYAEDSADVAQFTEVLRGRSGLGFGSRSMPAPGDADSMIARLERLAALHASGGLTDEEFTAAKAKLLR